MRQVVGLVPSWVARWSWPALVVALALALVVVWVARPRRQVVQVLCSPVASAWVSRCPPDTDRVVLGMWRNGAVATVRRNWGRWVLTVPTPSGGQVEVSSPADWRELEEEPDE